jgi:hypothetical protein
MRSSNPAERLAAALLIPGVLAQRLRELSDFNLGQLLEDEVWSNPPRGKPSPVPELHQPVPRK